MCEFWHHQIKTTATPPAKRLKAKRRLERWIPVLNRLIQKSLDENLRSFRSQPIFTQMSYDRRSFPTSRWTLPKFPR